MAAVSRGRGWFHVKPKVKRLTAMFCETLQTSPRTDAVALSCWMRRDGLSCPGGRHVMCCAGEDQPDVAAVWLLETSR